MNRPRPRPLLVGLTGGLAAGKSTVLAVFESLGAGAVDADSLARAALAPGSPLLGRVKAEFGAAAFAPDGSLDRARLAALAFASPERRRALEAIVHPEVIRREEEETSRLAAAGKAIIVVDAALLVEIGRHSRYDRLVVVVAPVEERVRRAVARGMAEADARARIAGQLPDRRKAELADHVIDGGGTLEETRAGARAVWAALVADAERLRDGLPLQRR